MIKTHSLAAHRVLSSQGILAACTLHRLDALLGALGGAGWRPPLPPAPLSVGAAGRRAEHELPAYSGGTVWGAGGFSAAPDVSGEGRGSRGVPQAGYG